MTIERYHLGLPIWSHKPWTGSLFTREAKPADFLVEYASVFNAVEGNSTFYGLPSSDTVERWRDDTPATFRFCFKLPRSITHERRLIGAGPETRDTFARLAPLGPRIGPYMIQLPPTFGPADLPTLERYLVSLPSAFSFAVEARHEGFFGGGADERALDSLLAEHGASRIIFDTRGLRSADPRLPGVADAQRRKPWLPVRHTATGVSPIVRYVAHPEVERNAAWLEDWAEVVAAWIAEGRRPYAFIHAPDEKDAPAIARAFHAAVAERADVGAMPPWPGESEPPPPEQLSLFGE